MRSDLKRLGAMIFALCLCVLVALGTIPVSAYVTEETYQAPDLLAAVDTVKVGIDISAWQETVDWAKIKKSGVEQAFLRLCTYQSSTGTYSVDPYLAQNVAGATAQGIPIGCYFFSYAKNMDGLRKEAQMILDILADYPATFALPVVFDCEAGIEESIATEACVEFCSIMRENGYYPMVYANSNWFNNIIDVKQLVNIDLWQAHYLSAVPDGVTPSQLASYASSRPSLKNNDSNVTVWQCTDSGTVSGCSGSANIDMNIFYKDYTQIIPVQGYNGYAKSSVVTAEPSSTLTAGGTKIPTSCQADPNVKIVGLDETATLNAFWGLERYGDNKSHVLINGRSWSMWDTKSTKAIERLWVYPAEVGSYYLGFDLNDPSALRLPSQSGSGEVIESIVLQKGFQFVTTASVSFGTDVTLTASNATVVGTLTENVMLDLRSGSIRVGIDGVETITSAEQYGVVVTTNASSNVNIRSERDTGNNSNIITKVPPNTELVYLGETVENWALISHNGVTGWISADYFRVTGHKVTTTDLNLPGYEIKQDKQVVVTAGTKSLNVRSAPDSSVSDNILGIVTGGDKLPYQNEQSGTWYKVIFEGKTAWVSANYSSVVDYGMVVLPLNAPFAQETPPPSSDLSQNGASEPSTDGSSASEPSQSEPSSSSSSGVSEPNSSTTPSQSEPGDRSQSEKINLSPVVTVAVLGTSLVGGISGGLVLAFKKGKGF